MLRLCSLICMHGGTMTVRALDLQRDKFDAGVIADSLPIHCELANTPLYSGPLVSAHCRLTRLFSRQEWS
jgi:hypothetical protein